MLKINNLTKSFGGLTAVNNVSLDFRAGKITSLIGPNGAGKTTLFNLITGFLKPDTGEIVYDGHLVHKMKPFEIAQLGIGRLFQDTRVFKKMSCLDNILLGYKDIQGENPLRAIAFAPRVKKLERMAGKKAEEQLEFVGLRGKKDAMAEDLSFGEQKLLNLAQLLFGEYQVLLLDEPTAGVNLVMIAKILEIIKNLAKKMNKMIIVIEHNMNVVLQISDWVYFMNEGEITAFGRPGDVLGNEEVRRIYIGL